MSSPKEYRSVCMRKRESGIFFLQDHTKIQYLEIKAYFHRSFRTQQVTSGWHNGDVCADKKTGFLCIRHGKSAAQVALRWNVQRGVSIIPKSVHVERMEQNIDIWDFELTDGER